MVEEVFLKGGCASEEMIEMWREVEGEWRGEVGSDR